MLPSWETGFSKKRDTNLIGILLVLEKAVFGAQGIIWALIRCPIVPTAIALSNLVVWKGPLSLA